MFLILVQLCTVHDQSPYDETYVHCVQQFQKHKWIQNYTQRNKLI